MSEFTYKNIFESIKSNLVPKAIYEESKNEISRLKLELQNAKNDFINLNLEYDEQKMAMNIIRAEKQSLENEAEKKNLEAEKKNLDEISWLKLELQNATKASNETKLEHEKGRNVIKKIKVACKSNYDIEKWPLIS